VHENRVEAILADGGFGNEQRLQLRVAVLFDDEIFRVSVDERVDAFIEGGGANAHVVDGNAFGAAHVHGLAHGAVTPAERNQPDGSALLIAYDGGGHRF